MNKIWETLSKPAELKDRVLSDYFDLSFAALPHKILAADKFEADVQELRRRFVDKSREDYVFKPAYHKRIPADGVAFYMEGIWVCHCLHVLWSGSGLTLVYRNKSRRTRISTYLPSKSCLRSSAATRSQQGRSPSSTNKRNRKDGLSRLARS